MNKSIKSDDEFDEFDDIDTIIPEISSFKAKSNRTKSFLSTHLSMLLPSVINIKKLN